MGWIVWMTAMVLAAPPEPTPARALDWSAPETCPDAAAITARVEQLIGRELDDGSESVRVRAIVEVGERPQVRLRVDSETGSRERTITAASCAELGEVAAVVIAVAIDPSASLRADAVEPEPPAPQARPVPPPAPPQPRERPAPEPTSPSQRTDAAHERRPVGTLRIGAGAATGALPGVTAALELGAGVRWRHARIDLWAEHWLGRVAEAPGANDAAVLVRLTIARAQGCWVPTAGKKVEFPLCAGAAIGAASARGRGVPEARVVRVAWAAAHLQAAVLFVPIRRLALGPFVRGQVPILRPAFSLDGYGVVHRTAAAGFVGGLSIELRFP